VKWWIENAKNEHKIHLVSKEINRGYAGLAVQMERIEKVNMRFSIV